MKGRKEIIKKLVMDYHRKCCDMHIFKRRSDLKKGNIIDLRLLYDSYRGNIPSWDDPTISVFPVVGELHSYKKEVSQAFINLLSDGWFAFIPCFETGVFQTSNNYYIEWEIVELSVDNRQYAVKLSCYAADDFGWHQIMCTSVLLDFNRLAEEIEAESGFFTDKDYMSALWICNHMEALDSFVARIVIDDSILGDNPNVFLQKLYRCVLNDQGGVWTVKEKELYKEFIEFIEKEDSGWKSENLIKSFLLNVLISNSQIALNRRKTLRQNERADGYDGAEVVLDPAVSSKRRTRVFGSTVIMSESVPKASRRDTVVRYKTASWVRRAHTRRLSNGKIQFVRETVVNRKLLQSIRATSVSPVTFVIKP